MKRVPIERWSGSFLPPRNPRLQCPFASTTDTCVRLYSPRPVGRLTLRSPRRCLSVTTRSLQEVALAGSEEEPLQSRPRPRRSRPDPLSHRSTAKLAALHARLSLPARFPLQTLQRCMMHPSASPTPQTNNSSLAILGQELLAYYTAEWLICNYPRLPMPVLFAAQYAYVGPKTLDHIRTEWGVEAAAAPGYEVHQGLLQFQRVQAGNAMAGDLMSRVKDLENIRKKGTGRSNEDWNYRRGMSSRIVYDDEFGDLHSGVSIHDSIPGLGQEDAAISGRDGESELVQTPAARGPLESVARDDDPVSLETASSTFIRAVFGALYLHSGTQGVQKLHESHIMSRHLPLHTLFNFKHPTRDLSRLCAREAYEPPVARLISETGRHTRTPVFVVGVYSGEDKLGEDAGASLNEARVRAAAAALRSWYLYSPPKEDVCLPSRQEQMDREGKRWKPQMVDMGEIVT